MNKDEIQKRIKEIETQMAEVSFWNNQEQAQRVTRELNELKAGLSKSQDAGADYDSRDAVMTLFGGAGGDDAEDFARILLEMYLKFIDRQGWEASLVHKNENDRGGFRNVTIDIKGRNAYGTLKNESGVHRLVRLSPFNSKQQRHTSFVMVEVIPKFKKITEVDIPESEVEIEYSKSSGPGGQNVNKRETAVRAVHTPTGIAVHVSSERSQAQNKEQALQMLAGKIHKLLQEERIQKTEGMYVSKETENEWGSQIRSYVMHPYQMVKDHRTEVEIRDIDSVLDGNLGPFIEAEKDV